MGKPTKPVQQEVGDENDLGKAALESLGALDKKLDDFIATYETDMRGDKDLTNGNKGVIGELRALRDMFQKYPSIAYSFNKNPIKTVALILTGFILLDTLSTFGLLRWLAGFFGVTVPAILTKTPIP